MNLTTTTAIATAPETAASIKGHECRCADCMRLRGVVVIEGGAESEPFLPPVPEPRNRRERRLQQNRVMRRMRAT